MAGFSVWRFALSRTPEVEGLLHVVAGHLGGEILGGDGQGRQKVRQRPCLRNAKMSFMA